MYKYTVIIEKTEDGFSASVPVMPGCVAIADSKPEVEQLIYDNIKFHLEGLEEEGLDIPIENETEIETMVFS